MMKKFLILSVLLLAVPAMAAVTITVTDSGLGDGVATISYTDTGDPNRVRAFALDVTVDSDANIIDCNEFMVGECNSVDRGYGIFPGRFSRYITPTTPDWGDPNYTPVAVPEDLPGDTRGGLGTGGVTLEMGSLYVDVNTPNPSGVLCTLTVDKTCNMTVAVNAGRGGVVLEDASTVVPTLTGAEIIVTEPGCACLGDANGSNNVDVSDLAVIVGLLGGYSTTTPPYTIYQPWPTEVDECWDVNADTMIDVSDLAVIVGFLGNYPLTTPPYSPPPGECVPAP